MKHSLYKTLSAFFFLAILAGCQTKEELSIQEEPPISMETKAVSPESFDWETIDFMPTPASQSIFVPWAPGNGSLDVFYGLDVLYDYEKENGWKLVYSTFKSSGSPLIDPFFVLYNVYRGTLRIYMYLNSLGGISPSSYIEDSIYLNGTKSSSILNFLGSDMVDHQNNVKAFNSVRPKPLSGGAPLLNNQWYMVEYEMAYDPELKNSNSLKLRFQLKTDSYNITSINLGGKAKSEVSGTVGASSSSPMDLIKGHASNAVTGVAAFVGSALLDKQSQEPTTADPSNNKLGINNAVFKNIVTTVENLATSFAGGIPSAACTLLSAIINGTSDSAGSAVSLKANTEIQLEGTLTSNAAVNTISMFIPGMYFPNMSLGKTIQGYIPLYNKTLGIVNFFGDNTLHIPSQRSSREVLVNRGGDDEYYTEYEIHRETRFSSYADRLVFNPELLKIATVSILSEDLVARENGNITLNLSEYDDYISTVPGSHPEIHNYEFGVRFLIKVQPKNGSPASYIFKTFKLHEILH